MMRARRASPLLCLALLLGTAAAVAAAAEAVDDRLWTCLDDTCPLYSTIISYCAISPVSSDPSAGTGPVSMSTTDRPEVRFLCDEDHDRPTAVLQFTPAASGVYAVATTASIVQGEDDDVETLLEVRSCTDVVLACSDGASGTNSYARVVVELKTGIQYVALVQSRKKGASFNLNVVKSNDPVTVLPVTWSPTLPTSSPTRLLVRASSVNLGLGVGLMSLFLIVLGVLCYRRSRELERENRKGLNGALNLADAQEKRQLQSGEQCSSCDGEKVMSSDVERGAVATRPNPPPPVIWDANASTPDIENIKSLSGDAADEHSRISPSGPDESSKPTNASFSLALQ